MMSMRAKIASGIAESNTMGSTSELLILPDGKILVHNLTPAFASVLSELNPADEQIQPRTAARAASQSEPHAAVTE
jgi:hypothetical protein